MTSTRRLTLLLSLAALAVACGKGEGSSSTPPPALASPLRGVFVDAPVANLGYRTPTLSGRTAADGSFQYRTGETVTFFIGAIETPPVAGASQLTPMAVFGAQDLASDRRTVNLARLLQTLDPGGVATSLRVPDSAFAAATASVDFGSPGFDDAVRSLVTTVKQDPGAVLVTSTQAVDHLAAQFPLVGGWVKTSGGELVTMTFFADGSYAEVEDGKLVGGSDPPGVEFGTYTWDASTHTFSARVGSLDTNQSPAFGPAGGSARATVVGSTLVFDAGGATSVVLQRVYDAASPIVGSWVYGSGNDRIVVTYLPDGRYVMGHGGTPQAYGWPGVEYGTYTFTATQLDPELAGSWTATAGSPDTNGEWGFSNPGPNGEAGTSRGNVSISNGQLRMWNADADMTWRRVGVR